MNEGETMSPAAEIIPPFPRKGPMPPPEVRGESPTPPPARRGPARDRHRQHVAQAQLRMRLVGGLSVDPDAALRHQGGALGPRPHEARAPEPFIQSLPVAVFLVRHVLPLPHHANASAPPTPRTARAPRRPSVAERRYGDPAAADLASIAGAGGPNISGARPPPGTIRKPRQRKMIGSNSVRTERREPRSRGSMMAPRRVK